MLHTTENFIKYEHDWPVNVKKGSRKNRKGKKLRKSSLSKTMSGEGGMGTTGRTTRHTLQTKIPAGRTKRSKRNIPTVTFTAATAGTGDQIHENIAGERGEDDLASLRSRKRPGNRGGRPVHDNGIPRFPHLIRLTSGEPDLSELH